MASYNRIIIIGNLTREPELTFLPSQTPVVEFGMASNRKYKGADGSQKEDVCFVDCRMYGKPAEVISRYCHKGDPLMVEGHLQFDQWQAQDGSKRSRHRIFVEHFEFLGTGRGKGQAPAAGENGPPGPSDGEISGGVPDDIPF
jgi:single-strand DNA-binding protein